MCIVGARPNFMKVAPLLREFRKHPEKIVPLLVHTGQHYDEAMSRVFFDQLEIPAPDVFLGVGSGSHAEQTANIMLAFEPVLLREKPDLVIVVGDVNSTMACTLVASKLGVPVAHVEAGLRSFDRTMPEEINRLVTDALADLLFTTSEDANENLYREGIPFEKIHFVGNTMIDTLLTLKPRLDPMGVLQRIGLNGQRYAYVTVHRPSNVDDENALRGICDAFEEVQERIHLVWPLHPRTRKMLKQFGLEARLQQLPHVVLVEPLGYIESISLLWGAEFVLTDSGGVQEESTVLGVPCLTLRFNTERPVTVTEGTNKLIGNSPAAIVSEATALLEEKSPAPPKSPKLWDGRASERITEILLTKLV